MARRPCGEECPIGGVSKAGGSVAEKMAALQDVVSGLKRVVCWGAGPTEMVSGERTVLLCFCEDGGTPQRFCLEPKQALELAHELLCALLKHQRETEALRELEDEVSGDGGEAA